MPVNTYNISVSDNKQKLLFNFPGDDVKVIVPVNTSGAYPMGWSVLLQVQNVNSLQVLPGAVTVNVLQKDNTVQRTDDLLLLVNQDGANTWKVSALTQRDSALSVNREVLSADRQLDVLDDIANYFIPTGSNRTVILTDPPNVGDYFILKNMSGTFNIDVKETATGPVVFTLDTVNSRQATAVYDGVVWNISIN